MLYQLSYSRMAKPSAPRTARGESRIRTYEDSRQQIYSLPQLATLVSPPFATACEHFFLH